jgi:HK97 family phage major capsid protein
MTLEGLRDERNQKMQAAQAVIDRADGENREFSDDERSEVDEAMARVDRIDGDISRLERADAAWQTAATYDAASNHEAAARGYDGDSGGAPVTVTRNEEVYRADGSHQVAVDIFHAQYRGDTEAHDRLRRHQQMHRDVASGDLGAFIPPQYLVDQWAAQARAARPFANSVPGAPLPPEGTVMKIPKIATGATAASQQENTAVEKTDIAETTVNVDLVTIAGQQDISRQSLERGDPMIDQIIFGDLAAAYAAELDNQVINGSGSNGQHTGVENTSSTISVTYTESSPKQSTLYVKLADALQRVNSQRYRPATLILMHPRRWGWMASGLDSSNRPLIETDPARAANVFGVGDPAAYGLVGALHGLPVVSDANVTTSANTDQDKVYVCRVEDFVLAEQAGGTPRRITFEETGANTLTVKMVVFSYSAFTAARHPKSTAVISGSGLAPPTFG